MRTIAVLAALYLSASPAFAADPDTKSSDAKVVADAAKEKGAEKTSSGLVYVPLKVGTGASPKATDPVKVHYEGKLVDGTVFDSSSSAASRRSSRSARVIPCWTEGVQKMKVGGKAKLICPPSIAYGDRGAPGAIPADATLVFEVELLGIQK